MMKPREEKSMPKEAIGYILSMVGFTAFALKWAMAWKTDGWGGHSFTIAGVALAALALAMAVSEIASN